MDDPLTSTLKPSDTTGSGRMDWFVATDSLLVIRVIKSFSYRVVKNLILPHVDLTTTTVKELKTKIHEGSSTGVLSDSRDTETIRFQTVSDYRLRYVEDLRQSTWI